MNDIDYKSTADSLRSELSSLEVKYKACKQARKILAGEVTTLEERLNDCMEGLKGQEIRDNRVDHLQRELSNARRLFMELYEESRTTKLRFGWLEEAATDAVNACEKHVGENMDRLRDELGLEMRGDGE